MIIKKRGTKTLVPEVYHMAHNVCDALFSQLVEVVLSDVYKELKTTIIEFDGGKPDDLEMDIESFIQWLVKNNRHDEVTTVTIKRIIQCVIPDFIDFVSESLNSINRGKFSVAYALLRKPFMDILLMFEQILNDKKDFAHRYYVQGDVTLHDPSNRKLDNQKQGIVSEAVSKLSLGYLFDSKYLYDIRYNNDIAYGLSRATNQALHIVTTHKNYRTPDQNLNFIFTNAADEANLWAHYYSLLPNLLLYVTSVVDEIVFDFIPDMVHVKNMKAVRRSLADMEICGAYKNYDKGLRNIIEGLCSELDHVCKGCNGLVRLDVVGLNVFLYTNTVVCKTCKANQVLDMDFVKKFPAEL